MDRCLQAPTVFSLPSPAFSPTSLLPLSRNSFYIAHQLKPQAIHHSISTSWGRKLMLHHRRRRKLSQNSLPSFEKARAQLFDFKARRELNVPYKEGAFPAADYIKEEERIVRITFPDSARIQYLGESTWRVRVKPVTFFTISATPYCDIKVFHQGKALQISSNRLILDFIGLSDQFNNIEIHFTLQGELIVANMSHLVKAQKAMFKGWVAAGLQADLPLPFSIMPEPIVLHVGDGILDRMLGVLEQALCTEIVKDYSYWCQKQNGYVLKVSSLPNQASRSLQ